MLHVDDEKRWRQALALMGRERIEDLLRRYPGRPDDPVTDLPVQAPFPTRDFCRQWCLSSSSRVARGYAAVGVTMALMAMIAASYAACSISPFNANNLANNQTGRGQGSQTAAGRGSGAGAGQTGGGGLTGPAASVQVPTVSTQGSATSSSSQSSSSSMLLPSNTAPPAVPGTFQVQTVTGVFSPTPSQGQTGGSAASQGQTGTSTSGN